MKQFIRNMLKPKVDVLIDCQIGIDGEYHFTFYQLGRGSGKNENIVKIEAQFKTLTPAYVFLKGKGILSKEKNEKDLSSLFPGIQLDDFVVEESNEHVRICRPGIIDELISQLKKLNVIPVEVKLGKQLNESPVSPPSTSSKYAGITQDHKSHIESWHYTRLTRLSFRAVIAMALILALSNFLVYDFFNDKLVETRAMVEQSRSKAIEYENLSRELSDGKLLLEKYGNKTNGQYAHYADAICAELPTELTLSKLDIHPIAQKRTRNGEIKEIHWDLIEIQGYSKDMNGLELWIKRLDAISFVKKTTLIDYRFDDKSKSGKFQITLGL